MAGGDIASPAKGEREMGGMDVEDENGWATADTSECGSESDDTETDPTFDVIELTRSKLSSMSLKKSRPRFCEEIAMPKLNIKEKKCFETVEKMIKDGELDKLKLEECKLYLRKYGLRLTGNKNVLQARIKEHLEVMDGGGEKKYPVSSFVLNCKGDACMGDVVMFEQNVYDMYNVASRSATAPSCGTRTVAGRIVKESYGAAKQQHTFTVEVLWSKGEKPFPPLHPLLIKGRNLYRLKTMRQRWDDEEERNRVLQEKHRRGSVARCSREVRIRGKEMKNMTGRKRRQALVSEKNVAAGAQNTRRQPLISQKSIAAVTDQNTQHQAVASEKSTVAGAQNTWHQAFVSENPIAAGTQNAHHQALVSDMPIAARSQNTRQHGPVCNKPSAAAGAQNTLHQALVSGMPIAAAGAQNILHQALVSGMPIAAAGAQNILHQALVSGMPIAAGSQNTGNQGPVFNKPSAAAGLGNAVYHQVIQPRASISALPMHGMIIQQRQDVIVSNTTDENIHDHNACVRPKKLICAGQRGGSHQLSEPETHDTTRQVKPEACSYQSHGSHGDGFADRRPLTNLNSSSILGSPPLGSRIHSNHQDSGFCQGRPWRNQPYQGDGFSADMPWRNSESPARGRSRNQQEDHRPCRNFNSPSKGGPQYLRQHPVQRHPCRWHLQGTCWYGDNCRYLH